MFNRISRGLTGPLLALLAGPALAAVVSLSGKLDDPSNTALVASDMGAAQFIDELASANNVALHVLHVALGGTVSVTSLGFAAGGIDPYFTLFSGTDWATAGFSASNYLHAVSVGGDFTQDLLLSAGDYTLAIGVFENLSFAENLGSGVLGDGFTALGGPLYFGDGHYAFTVTLPEAATVPEPGGALLGLTAACAAGWSARRRRPLAPNEG
ncbi:DVUA0089 family protein [Paucibacter sediminis]|uniref:DVUA0089 family protein n=1 Tax=Paucibacter sediminis TaxID=3019553 RepID=A0AA95NH03_9BURK|nr:DVUA0089 family protein [Paucibacter sp. S2-9]WIT14199.1 DVUA0089 family protein [Paucibacter sp. S2-9]